jgi:hypothetical protein
MPAVCRSISVIYTDEDVMNNPSLEHFLVETPAFDITIHNISSSVVFVYTADQKEYPLKIPIFMINPGSSCVMTKSQLSPTIYARYAFDPYYACFNY